MTPAAALAAAIAALREIRKAAGSAENFTNRLQYIHARAGAAIDGLPWDYGERERVNGYHIRDRTMLENDELRAALQQALRDSERLDWMANALGAVSVNNADPEEHLVDGLNTPWPWAWRQAIDAALATPVNDKGK